MKFTVNYEIKTEDENGNAIWESAATTIRARSAEEAEFEVRYSLEVENGAEIRNLNS